jgi:hypothetical protein
MWYNEEEKQIVIKFLNDTISPNLVTKIYNPKKSKYKETWT